MTKDQFIKLKEGDIVRGKYSGDAYIVTNRIGIGEYVGTRTIKLTCPEEWDLWEYNEPKPDSFQEWFDRTCWHREEGFFQSDLRRAFEAGMKAEK